MRAIVAFRWWYLFFFAAGLALLASFYLDPPALAWVAQHQDASARSFFRSVSKFGDWYEHVAVGFILLGLAWWRGNNRWMRIVTAMILACALAGVAARAVKISTGRPRPAAETETSAMWNGPSLKARYNAFPSGHTAASTAFFATLALVSWRIGAGCLVIPLLIGFSRMYVAAHHLSDVVAGAVLGLLAAYFIVRWRLRERPEPQPG
jgi:membrane-associated phospholipid phosphatase